MKILITIIFLFFIRYSDAQIDSTKLDTLRLFVKTLDTVHYYDYYNAAGGLLWKQVKGYDVTLIPNGGYSVQKELVNPLFKMINGFGVIRWRRNGDIDDVVKWLDGNKKEIKDKWVAPELILR